VEAPPPAAAPVQSVTMGYVVPIVVALGLAVAVTAAIAIARKKKTVPALVAAKWS
jgi:hypothetical protein